MASVRPNGVTGSRWKTRRLPLPDFPSMKAIISFCQNFSRLHCINYAIFYLTKNLPAFFTLENALFGQFFRFPVFVIVRNVILFHFLCNSFVRFFIPGSLLFRLQRTKSAPGIRPVRTNWRKSGRSHFFEEGCMTGGTRFLAKCSPLPSREVSFPRPQCKENVPVAHF